MPETLYKTEPAADCADDGPEKISGERCYHCGTVCTSSGLWDEGRAFCCRGCLTVCELLTACGLENFYQLDGNAGVRVPFVRKRDEFKYLDDPAVRARLVDYEDERLTRVTLRLPAIHCIACVWLLENLFRLKPGIGRSEVNFPRKEARISFETGRVTMSELVTLLASLGYEPELKLSDLDRPAADRLRRRLWMQIGVAGFAFGNIMLFSISSYLGLDALSGPGFKPLFAWLSLLLAIPVFLYSAADYWRSAWVSLRRRRLTIEVPIAAGMAALFTDSVFEVLSGRGGGYFDSFSGLLFFLLCGRLFQQKTYDRLAFDRDYRCFFPLSATRRAGIAEEKVALAQINPGDRLVIRNGELIPADATLVSGAALIDYSFVTGEAEPVPKRVGEHLFSGGRQMGGAIEVEALKPVSQSHLASLWNQEAFRKGTATTIENLTNLYSRRFTKLVLAIAIGAATFWAFREPGLSVKAFTSVLIVACPCALALAAPFTLGTAQRVLAARGIFLKNPQVIETLARVNTVVFDKTGTLTGPETSSFCFYGRPLIEEEQRRVVSLARQSTHPFSARIGEALGHVTMCRPVRSFAEETGRGIEGQVDGSVVRMGSAAWLGASGVEVPKNEPASGSLVHVAFDGKYRGCFSLMTGLRADLDALMGKLSVSHELALVSGDNDREREKYRVLFGANSPLHFNQTPQAKLEFIRARQEQGRVVMMIGDGLNDAGALKQSDVGVAVVENSNCFSPASDVIMNAAALPRLREVLSYAKSAVRTVRLSFLISSLYNAVGISIAARGLLSPVVCAILMPLSSITVVAFSCGVARWCGRRAGLGALEKNPPRQTRTPIAPRPLTLATEGGAL